MRQEAGSDQILLCLAYYPSLCFLSELGKPGGDFAIDEMGKPLSTPFLMSWAVFRPGGQG